jgi:hypothetical protein
MSSVQLLPLCSTPKLAIRDGLTGAYARLLLPFYQYGYWFASGQQYTFANSEVPQASGLVSRGTNQASTFVKAAGVCLNQ